MTERRDLHDEMRRQRLRLERDLISRQIGVALCCVVFGVVLPFWVVFLTYLVSVGSEVVVRHQMLAFEDSPTAGRRTAVLAASAFGFMVFSLPPLLVWHHDDPLIKFLGVLALLATLLNISVIRSTHLALGLTSGLLPALALLAIPLSSLGGTASDDYVALAAFGAIVVICYFISALVQNHRAQADLVRAVNEAREASRTKSRFLSALSHEIRTPLTAILGHSDLLESEASAGSARTHAVAIQSAARGLKMLVEDVVDLSSVTEGEIRFTPVTSVIRQELEMIASMKLPVPADAKPEISIEIAQEVPEFGRFDALLLRKCLSHLATIVLSSQGEGDPPQLDIRCALAPGRKDRLRLTLAGREPTRNSDPEPASPAGEPLSMTLVHRISEVMGARSAVLKAPDGSLVARIELPFVMVPEPPDTGAETVYGKLRALVVDDIATNRFVVVQMLRALRIEAVEAGSGADALERLASDEFDFVLLDMNMPDMDGEATFREIRASGAEWSGIPVVALTADSVTYRRDHFIELGFNGYVTKPIDRRLLWAEILAAVPPPPPL